MILGLAIILAIAIGSSNEKSEPLNKKYDGKFITVPSFENTEIVIWKENIFKDCIAATETKRPPDYDVNVCRYSVEDSSIAHQALDRYSKNMENGRTVLKDGLGGKFGGRKGFGKWELLYKKMDNSGFYFSRFVIADDKTVYLVFFQVNAGLPTEKRAQISDWIKKWEFKD